MKLSDYVAQFLKEKTDLVFCVTGGCAVNLIDSIAKVMPFQPMAHEQGAAFAADAYAKLKGFSAVVATSGPGATNLLTGVCCAWYDSTPVMFITGQVPSGHLSQGPRQVGFQETDVCSIFDPVTKYGARVTDPQYIRFQLEMAFHLATEGRKGPVLLDICDDVQRAEIDPEKLIGYDAPKWKPLPQGISPILDAMKTAQRPLLIFGAGARGADFSGFEWNVPYTLTWGAYGLLPHDSSLFAGPFGVSSSRSGNFAIQNADLIIAIGTRLDTHETGSSYKGFAPNAKKIVVDFDAEELDKFAGRGMEVTTICAEAASVVEQMSVYDFPYNPAWLAKIEAWRRLYPPCTKEDRAQTEGINPYVFMEALSEVCDEDAVIVTGAGSAFVWTMQGFHVKRHRLIHAMNHSPMGYGLPGAIGAALATNRQVIAIVGDGGFQMSIQELAILNNYGVDVKVFVMNNHGYGMIKGTQDAWLGGRHYACDGVAGVDFKRIANAYGIPSFEASLSNLKDILSHEGPVLANVDMKPECQIAPKLLYGNAFDDLSPRL